MTRERAREILPIIAAFAEGKTVQFEFNRSWHDAPDPDFGAHSVVRIKPAPLECWVNYYPNNGRTVHNTGESAKECRLDNFVRTVHMREVEEEQL